MIQSSQILSDGQNEVEYEKWIKKQPCAICRNHPVDPHHLIGIDKNGAVGSKAPWYALMPLCRECHNKLHDEPFIWPEQWEMVTKMLWQAIKEGVLCVVKKAN